LALPPLPLRVIARNEAIHKLFGRRFSSFRFGINCIDDTVYHIGASLKDSGKKWFAFSRMEIGAEGLRGKMG
jgi:hypothetical protein